MSIIHWPTLQDDTTQAIIDYIKSKMTQCRSVIDDSITGMTQCRSVIDDSNTGMTQFRSVIDDSNTWHSPTGVGGER